MKALYMRYAAVFALIVVLTACSDNAPGNDSSMNPAASAPTLADIAPVEGMCAGWRRSLAQGRHVNKVEACLRQKALDNRPEAVKEATAMVDWDIDGKGDSELEPLITALSQYPEPGSLERYLASQSLLPNAPGEYHRLDQALTASDYLRDKGNIHWFDVETGMFPNYHDELLAEVARLSDLGEVRFTEKPPSDYDAYEEPYRLKAVVAGKTYRQEAENHGDWYDLHAVLMLLNRIALDQSSQSRFVTLPTGDQTAIIWVVEEQKLARLVGEGLVSLSPAELSMQTGKAFEAEVRNKFGGTVE